MAKIQALFILCMVNYCLGQGFGGNDWQEDLGMEDSVTGDTMSSLTIPLVSTTGDESSSAVYGSMQDGTGAMYGTKPDGTFYGSGQDGTGTVYGRRHQVPSPRKNLSAGKTQHGTVSSSENEAAQIVYEESSGDQYSYEEEEEDEMKNYGEDVYVETSDDQTDEGQGTVVYFDVGKKQAEIDQITIKDSDEDENYHERFKDIVALDYAERKFFSRKDNYEDTKSTDTSEESRFLTPVHFSSGSGGAAAGGGSGTTTVSSEVPDSVKVMTVSKKIEFSCNNSKNELGEYITEIDWYHDGNSLTSDERVQVFVNGTVVINPAQDSDTGNYSCHYRNAGINLANTKTYTLIILSYKKLPKSGTAIEEENFSLTCEVEAKPVPTLTWKKDNVSVFEIMDNSRFNLSRKDDKWPENSTLTIYGIKREDRGMYECCFSNYGGFEICTRSNIRVKDIYAALWPFLGIVAEVVILCLIIFIYEKRRTKNDFDESDTDQGNNMKEGPN